MGVFLQTGVIIFSIHFCLSRRHMSLLWVISLMFLGQVVSFIVESTFRVCVSKKFLHYLLISL